MVFTKTPGRKHPCLTSSPPALTGRNTAFAGGGVVHILDRFPGLKARLADVSRRMLKHVFEPGLVTTERVIEYPFVFQNLDGATGPVLDIGCCYSRLPIAMASRGFQLVGIDVKPYPFRHPNFFAVCGDAMGLPFRDGSFQVVVAVSVIEHIGIGHYGDPSAGSVAPSRF